MEDLPKSLIDAVQEADDIYQKLVDKYEVLANASPTGPVASPHFRNIYDAVNHINKRRQQIQVLVKDITQLRKTEDFYSEDVNHAMEIIRACKREIEEGE
jgi:hypothetical protein